MLLCASLEKCGGHLSSSETKFVVALWAFFRCFQKKPFSVGKERSQLMLSNQSLTVVCVCGLVTSG